MERKCSVCVYCEPIPLSTERSDSLAEKNCCIVRQCAPQYLITFWQMMCGCLVALRMHRMW